MDKNRIKVLLADDNVEFCSSVLMHLNQQEDIEVIKIVHNGIDAYKQITELKPDIAILDGAMPGLDGLGVLEKLNSEENRPICIMLSSLRHDNITQYAYSLGAEYYIIKPFEMDTLAQRIRMFGGSKTLVVKKIEVDGKYREKSDYKNYADIMNQDDPDYTLKKYIAKILFDIGLPQHIKGNHYIRAAIVLAVKKPEILYYITKRLYPNVAKECKTTSTSVERAIRNAIEIVWTRGNIEGLKKYFGYSFKKGDNKPTNGEFIAFIADKLRMENFK